MFKLSKKWDYDFLERCKYLSFFFDWTKNLNIWVKTQVKVWDLFWFVLLKIFFFCESGVSYPGSLYPHSKKKVLIHCCSVRKVCHMFLSQTAPILYGYGLLFLSIWYKVLCWLIIRFKTFPVKNRGQSVANNLFFSFFTKKTRFQDNILHVN